MKSSQKSMRHPIGCLTVMVLIILWAVVTVGEAGAVDNTYDFAGLGTASGGFKPQGNRFLVSELFEDDAAGGRPTAICYNTTSLYPFPPAPKTINGIIIKADGTNLISFDLKNMGFGIYPGGEDETISSLKIIGTKVGGGTVTTTVAPGYQANGTTFSLVGLAGLDLSGFTNITQLQFDITTSSDVWDIDFMTITLANEASGIVTTPTAQATAVQTVVAGATELNLSWTSGNGSSRVVFAKEGATSGVPTVSDGATYAADPDFSAATDCGNGWKSVYNGNGNSVSLSGISASTQYRFVVFEYNGSSGNEKYLTTLAGNALNHSTIAPFGVWSSGRARTADLSADVQYALSDAERDSSGNTYVMHRSDSSWTTEIQKWNGSSWATLTSTTPSAGGYASFSLTGSNYPITNYRLAVTGVDNLRFATVAEKGTALNSQRGIIQATYNGSAWSFQDVAVYSDPNNYIRCDRPVIAVDGAGNSHILYEHLAYTSSNHSQDLKLASWNGSGWSYTVINTIANAGNGNEVATDYLLLNDAANKQHVFYFVYTTATSKDLHYWTNASGSGIDTTLFTGSAEFPAGLQGAIDSSGKLHVTYHINTFYNTDGYSVKYLTNTSGSWVMSTLLAPGFGYYPLELRINGNGDMVIPVKNMSSKILRTLLKQGSAPWSLSTASPTFSAEGIPSVTFRDDGMAMFVDANQTSVTPRVLQYSLASLMNTAPTISVNTGLTLNQNASATTIPNTKLQVTDLEQAAGALTYTIGTAPAKGTLKKSTVTLGASNTFTQDDLDNSRITYTPSGTQNGADSITFTVSDGAGGSIGSTTFNITIIDNVAPSVAISYSPAGPYKEGDAITITATFSEAMATSPVPKIAISGANTLGAAEMTRTDATRYTYAYTVAAGGGTATVTLSIGTDVAGNVITSTPTSGASFTVVPAPTVTDISPSMGPTAGGTTVTLTGTNFTGATAVNFGSTPAASFTVNSATQITATSPAGSAGTVDITVTTIDGTATSPFTYVTPPSITGISPSMGPAGGGTTVTITGTNFTGVIGVQFDGVNVFSFTVVSDTQITTVSPAVAGTVNITVYKPGGGYSATSSADQFTYVLAPVVGPPTPLGGPTAGGTSVTIPGFHLTGATAVKFGSTNASSYTVDSDSQITAIAPAASAGLVDITVTTPGGTATGPNQYVYVAAAPTVSDLSPDSGATSGGTTVRIYGTNLAYASAVLFGSTAAVDFTVDSATQITALSPPGSTGPVYITVTTPGGSATGASPFTYGVPTVTGISPSRGPSSGGTTVVITGTNFTGAKWVEFGGWYASSFTIDSATRITAISPSHPAETVDITVRAFAGASATSSADQFTFVPPPTVGPPTPSEGTTAGGTAVTIVGFNFTGATSVKFGSTEASGYTVDSDSQITAIAPAGAAGPVYITVTTVGGAATGAIPDTSFTYVAPPAVTSVSVPLPGTYIAGQNLDFTVNWSENVTVTGSESTLGLTIGDSSRAADYLSKTGTSITYRYTVQSGDRDADGIGIGSLTLNTTTIRNSDGFDAVLSLNSIGSTAAVLVAAIPPTLTAPATTNTGANIATLSLQSDSTGTGYFTLLVGSGTACGSGTQVKNGQNSTGGAAFRIGSLPLTADTTRSYAVRNLTESTDYTVCFTADDGANLQATPATVDFTTTAAIDLTTSAWTTVGSAGFSADIANDISLSFAPDGTPYVAFRDGGNGEKATVMMYGSSGTWTTVGSAGFSADAAWSTSLSFAPDGTPYVAYRDEGYGGKATVMMYSSGAWTTVGSAGFSAGAAYFIKLSIAPDGTPYVAYTDEGLAGKATVMMYSSGAWTTVGSAGFSAGRISHPSLTFAPDGTPYLAYRDTRYDYYNATVMTYSSGAWTTMGIASFVGEKAEYISLSFAPDGTPYLAYTDADEGFSNAATVMMYSSGAWTPVGSIRFSADGAFQNSLSFAPDGTPHVAYTDGGNSFKATVMKYDGASWVAAGSAGFSAGAAFDPSLSFAPDGTPYVAYRDEGYGSKATVMKLAPAYTATYAGNGATGGSVPLDSGIYLSGATVTVSANTGGLAKTGYTFAGWNTAADGSGTSHVASGSATFTMGAGNVTLYAQWTINSYTVTFDLAGGARTGGGELTQTIAYGQGATEPLFTDPAGKVFSGWDTPFGNIAADTTVTARYVDYTLPVAPADSYDIHLGQLRTVAAPGVLANDSDADGQTLTAVLVGGPAHASAFTLNGDGSFSYTHDGTASGNDSFTYRAGDGHGQSAVVTVTLTLYTRSQISQNLSVNPSNYLFGIETLDACAASKAIPFTVRNTGAAPLNLGSLDFGGPDALQFAFGTDNCSGQTLAAGATCTTEVKFCPTGLGSKTATLHIPSDDAVTPVLTALLHNHESPEEEAQRRLPPVLYAVSIPEEMIAGQTYTLTWSLLGYHDDYKSNIAFFNCDGLAAGACGNNYGGNFAASGNIDPISSTAGAWDYNGFQSRLYTYSYDFTAPSVAADTDIVIRFYSKSADDHAAGKGGLSLLIPGNLSARYYDDQGRRILRTITGP